MQSTMLGCYIVTLFFFFNSSGSLLVCPDKGLFPVTRELFGFTTNDIWQCACTQHVQGLALWPAAPVACSTYNLLYTADWKSKHVKCWLSSSTISFAVFL